MRMTGLRQLEDNASTLYGALEQVVQLTAAIDAVLIKEGRPAYWGDAVRNTVKLQQVKCLALLDKLRAKTADVGDL